MHKIGIDTSTADGANEFTEGVPGVTPATNIMTPWLNTIQREGAGLVEASGQALNPADDLQWVKSVGVVLNTMAELDAVADPTIYRSVFVLGYDTPGDGGGGPYNWKSASVLTHNAGTVWLPAGHVGAGRFELQHNDTVCLEQFGVKFDGATVNTTAIQYAFDAGISNLTSGAGIAVTGAITITASVNYAASKSIFKLAANSSVIIQDTSNVTITGLEVDGDNYLNLDHGILIQRASYVRVEKCYFHHVKKNGISVGGNETKSGHRFIDNDFDFIGAEGVDGSIEGNPIYSYYTDDVEIRFNRISKCNGIGINVIGPTDNTWVANNTINDTFATGIQLGLGIKTRALVTHNTLKNIGTEDASTVTTGKVGIFVWEVYAADVSVSPWEVMVTHNNIENVIENGIEGACYAISNTIKNTHVNPLHTTPSRAGISLSSQACAINNTVINPGGDGIYSNYPYKQRITGNKIIDPLGYAGIRVKLLYAVSGVNKAENFICSDNIISDAGANITNGIFLFKDGSTTIDAGSCSVSNNTITGQSAEGVKDSIGITASHNTGLDAHSISLHNYTSELKDLVPKSGASNMRWSWSYGMRYSDANDNWDLISSSTRTMIVHDNNAISMFLVDSAVSTPISSTTLRNNHTVLQVTNNKVVQCPGGVSTFTKAGIPSDADFSSPPPSGTIVIDTTNNRIYAKSGVWWMSAALS